jgi:hypothetical protein
VLTRMPPPGSTHDWAKEIWRFIGWKEPISLGATTLLSSKYIRNWTTSGLIHAFRI